MKPPQWLLDLAVPATCIKQSNAATERRRFELTQLPGIVTWRVHVDGCWLQSQANRKVDYLFCRETSRRGWDVVLVEFKGRHYLEALKQIEDTLAHLFAKPLFHKPPPKRLHAVAVLSKGREVGRDQKRSLGILKRYGVKVIAKSEQYTMTL